MIFEITGIRFQMKGATKDEQTTKAEQFIDSLTFPCQVMLMREMDNIYSSHAIAVYYECRRWGMFQKTTPWICLMLVALDNSVVHWRRR